MEHACFICNLTYSLFTIYCLESCHNLKHDFVFF